MTEEQLTAKMKQILEDYGSLLDSNTVEGESEDILQNEKKPRKLKKISRLN